MVNKCEHYHQCKPTQLDENLVIPIIAIAEELGVSIYHVYFTLCMGSGVNDGECPRKKELDE